MNDNYLWDRSGPPDPEVQRLENLLGTLRHNRPAPEFAMPVRRFPSRLRQILPRFAAVAAIVVLVVAATLLARIQLRQSWAVSRLAGAPQVGSRPIGAVDRLPVGDWLVTDSASRAMIDVGLIGEVEVKPNSRLRLVSAAITDHRLELRRGAIFARIWAPPRVFAVETPSASAVDLGCVYTLEVDDAGVGVLRVETGLVTLAQQGRESLVPAGAMCISRPRLGPGTPYFETASEKLKRAIEQLDPLLGAPSGGVTGGIAGGVSGGIPGGPVGGMEGGVPGGVESGIEGGTEGVKKVRAAALDTVLREARKEDALTLWHLLVRVSEDEKARVFDRMAQLVPPPAGVTREGILRGDPAMRDAWADRLGIGLMSWWRYFWQKPMPAPR